MRTYTVLAPPPAEKAGVPEALRFLFVKDGFSWPALFFPFLWMLSRRLFLAAALYVLAAGAFVAFERLAGEPAIFVLIAARIGLAFLANDLRRFFLHRRGYVLVGEASGRSIDEAEIRYFLNRPEEPAAAPLAPLHPPRAVMPEVLGLFPTAGATS